MQVPAVVAAGDRGAARPIHGESKVYLEIDGRPLVAHVVAALQRVPEVSEVWVVGDAERLGAALAEPGLRAQLRKPLHVLPQFRNLFENLWESYRRLLPGAGEDGRDPAPDAAADLDTRVLYLSGDLPFATAQEISAFVRQSLEVGCDYALGLVTEEAMTPFYPAAPGEPGIRMAYFNLREGRFRQSNLHLVKPGRMGNRHYIQEMYENRFQKEWGSVLSLAWRLLRSEKGGLTVIYYFVLMHMAGVADRLGWRRVADRLRSWIPIARIERGVSELLRTEFRFVATDVGGCAVDVDNDHDYDVAKQLYDRWFSEQLETAERLYGRLALPEPAGPPPEETS